MGAMDWTDETWGLLIDRIDDQLVTPLLGAGASIDLVGDARKVAAEWVDQANYPFADGPSLAAVAQYVATTVDRASAGEHIAQVIDDVLDGFGIADIDDEHDVYRYLPSCDLPIWITTNYDDLIERGLRWHGKSPSVARSDWAPPGLGGQTPAAEVVAPSADEPLVFHLHGTYRDDLSMVITETDYLEFLEQMATAPADIVPEVVRDALARTSLLFIGYGFRDLNLQLMLRQWDLPRKAYVVQPLPSHLTPEQATAWKAYYPQYLRSVTGATATMFWGTASEFCSALDDHLVRSGP